MRTRTNLGIALVLAVGLLVAWAATPLWAGENGPATRTPPLRGMVPVRSQSVALPATAVRSTVPARLAPGQVPPPTFEPGKSVPNLPWSANTLLATDTNASGYSPPDGGITVNGNNVFASMNYFPNNSVAGWAISRSTNRGVSWLAPYQWAASAGGDPTPFAGGRDTTYLIEFNGGFNGFQWTRTVNGGTSWSAPATVINESGLDKELMCIDTVNTNYMYLEWVNFGASWGDMHFSRSTDKGTTWSTPVVINDGAGTGYRTGAAPWVGRGPYSGHVYCVWQDDRLGGDGRICMKKSTDHGVTWVAGSEITAANIHLVPAHSTISNWRRPMHAYPANHPRPFPAVGTDSQGRIFISYCSAPTGGSSRNYDPMVTVSSDEGTTWSTPVSANMAVSGDTADQYLPWLWVDRSDVVHVFWCDMRNYNNLNGDVYYSYSRDHGATFSTPEQINDVSPCLYGSVAANYQGDYNMICADPTRVYVEWCDNRTRGGNWQDVDAAYRDFISGAFHDVGVSYILTPGARVNPLTPIAPVVTVQNYGTFRETSVPVHFRVDSLGTTVYNNLQTIATLDSGTNTNVTFANWTPGPGGITYNLIAYTANVQDTNRTNDTLKAVTQTRVHEISSVSTSIGSRVRALTAITPQLTLGDPGDYTEKSFNATCWIDSGATRLYNYTVVVDSVVSGGSKTVSFPVWNTGPVGANYNLTFFNSFSDPNHGNDTLKVATQASNQAKALIAFADLPANAWAVHDTLVAHDSSHLFSTIDTFNVGTSGGRVLPLSTILQNGYNVVVTWTNYGYSNSTAMGDTLAAFMDQGGGVVIAVFADQNGIQIGGRYATQYMPLPTNSNTYTAGTLGTVHLPTHPIMAGISAISVGSFVTAASTLQHGVDVADFNTAHILAGAFDTLGRRTAALGFFPATFNYSSWGGQDAHLILNAMCWAAGLCNPSGVEALPALGDLPRIFALAPARPNPVSGATEIRYQLPTASPVQIRVYNVAGQVVKTLVDAKQEVGYKSVTWDGRNDRGVPVGSGVYLYRMEAGSFTATRKMVVVR